ncbi:hypothetical protein QLQ12_25645 [Actinoplanes sp. NEAU-A12]|uniref:Uncharacterized protein n=1 Tax=Actinoplanes sandaracinus TaxID=3045177 RepID=A0ABT6WQK3_9ACTN|nr:hypothetical protein [Actinoplanes sandaracinus]MDI6102008.1 hypothetical protein [Actinoplanes sandaracinus]
MRGQDPVRLIARIERAGSVDEIAGRRERLAIATSGENSTPNTGSAIMV